MWRGVLLLGDLVRMSWRMRGLLGLCQGGFGGLFLSNKGLPFTQGFYLENHNSCLLLSTSCHSKDKLITNGILAYRACAQILTKRANRGASVRGIHLSLVADAYNSLYQ